MILETVLGGLKEAVLLGLVIAGMFPDKTVVHNLFGVFGPAMVVVGGITPGIVAITGANRDGIGCVQMLGLATAGHVLLIIKLNILMVLAEILQLVMQYHQHGALGVHGVQRLIQLQLVER